MLRLSFVSALQSLRFWPKTSPCAPVVALFCASLLFGCATKAEEDQPAEVYFSRAMSLMEDQDYALAIERLEQLNAIHPFSQYSEQALLELAYAYYQNQDRQRCRSSIARLLRQYPDSEQTDYALYLRAIANFDEDRNLLHNAFGANPAQRSLQGARQAYADFERITRDFPNSRFAADSRQYMIYIRDQLALKEVLIGEFYLKRNANVAALGRAQEVLRDYVSTSHAPQALDLAARAYSQMGMTNQAEQSWNQLAELYPGYVAAQTAAAQAKQAGK